MSYHMHDEDFFWALLKLMILGAVVGIVLWEGLPWLWWQFVQLIAP